MRKQSEAKERQGYTTESSNCGNCRQLDFNVELPAWMIRENERCEKSGAKPYWDIKSQGVQKKLRCAAGGFAIKKTATCNFHIPKEKS